MVLPADLYTLLRFYANKIRNPSFTLPAFVTFLEKYAQRFAIDRPELAPWSVDTQRKVEDGIPGLVESGKCAQSTSERGTIILVNQYYVDIVQQVWKTMDDTPELPFPDEMQLKTVFPSKLLRVIELDKDFTGYLDNPQGSILPVIKLIFPESSGVTLLLSGMIPKRLLEISLTKLRHYLKQHNNREYIQHKLLPTFQGRESMLKDILNQMTSRPADAMASVEQAGDFSFQFWAYFASLVKTDIRKKNDLLSTDLAALQSVYIVELLSNYYRGKVQKQRDAENALKNLDGQLDRLPYCFSMEDIVHFKDTKGVPLLGQYTREALEKHLHELTTSGDLNHLPDLLVVHGPGDVPLYIRKTRLLALFVKLLGEARAPVKNALSQRWYKILAAYKTEKAMESDEDFNQTLLDLTRSINPLLAILLQENRVFLVHEELERNGTASAEASKLFFKGNLIPICDLFMLSRKALKTDVLMLLPFWHSVGILVAIISFFKHLGNPKVRTAKPSERDEAVSAEPTSVKTVDTVQRRRQELREAARRVEAALVPEGRTLEECLEHELERWNRLIGEKAKSDLTEDVNVLIRDFIRRTYRSLKAASFTSERVSALAKTLSESPTLDKINEKDALQAYIRLYMVRLVLKA